MSLRERISMQQSEAVSEGVKVKMNDIIKIRILKKNKNNKYKKILKLS